MDTTLSLEIIKRLVDIDKHTDVIKDRMKDINKAQSEITSEMQIIGKKYLEILIFLKKNCEM